MLQNHHLHSALILKNNLSEIISTTMVDTVYRWEQEQAAEWKGLTKVTYYTIGKVCVKVLADEQILNP